MMFSAEVEYWSLEVHGRFCAVPLAHVVEIMQPLPV